MKNSLIILVFLLGNGSFPAAASDYAGWWNFNEGSGTIIYDKSGNGNNGTITGSAWTNGIEGKALAFSTANDYVVIPDNPVLNFNSSLAFSISVWVKGSPTQVQDAGIVNKGVATLEEYCIDASLGGYRFYARNSYANVTMVVSEVFPSNSWDHVAAIFDKAHGLMQIFVNGVLKASGTPPADLYPSSAPLAIGNRKNIGSSNYDMPFNGCIDDLRIFNRALTGTEVKSLFNNPQSFATYPCLIPVPSPTYNRRPVMNWHPIPQAGAYTIQIDTTMAFFNPIIKTPTNDTTYKPLVDLPIDTIYWQITAGINDTLSYFSETGSFIIQDPRVPVLIPIVPKATQQKRPVFSWHPVSGASSYTLQVSSNNAFNNPIVVLPLTDTLDTASTDLPTGSIYWRVKSDLLDKWSIVDSFQIQSDTVPYLVRFEGAKVTNVRPKFMWEKVTNATAYRIEWADNAKFANTFATLVQDTSFTPTADLTSGTWYWQVSCDMNYSMFPLPDSLVIVPPNGIRAGNTLSSRMLFGGRECEASVYTLAGIRIAKIRLESNYKSIDGFLTSSGIKLAKGVYLIELKKDGVPTTRETYLQR